MACRFLSPHFCSIFFLLVPLLSLLSLPRPVLCQCKRPPVIFNFGDSNSDTGGLVAGLGFPVNFPNGRAFFHRSTGRLSDGRLLIDLLCKWALAFNYDRSSCLLFMFSLTVAITCNQCAGSCLDVISKLSLSFTQVWSDIFNMFKLKCLHRWDPSRAGSHFSAPSCESCVMHGDLSCFPWLWTDLVEVGLVFNFFFFSRIYFISFLLCFFF